MYIWKSIVCKWRLSFNTASPGLLVVKKLFLFAYCLGNKTSLLKTGFIFRGGNAMFTEITVMPGFKNRTVYLGNICFEQILLHCFCLCQRDHCSPSKFLQEQANRRPTAHRRLAA